MAQLMPLTLSGAFDKIARLEHELAEANDRAADAQTVANLAAASIDQLRATLAPFAAAYAARLAESPQYDNHPGDVLMNATLPLAAWRAAHRAVDKKGQR